VGWWGGEWVPGRRCEDYPCCGGESCCGDDSAYGEAEHFYDEDDWSYDDAE
jgi:hypothetical protein